MTITVEPFRLLDTVVHSTVMNHLSFKLGRASRIFIAKHLVRVLLQLIQQTVLPILTTLCFQRDRAQSMRKAIKTARLRPVTVLM
jgi:hypothetical protein